MLNNRHNLTPIKPIHLSKVSYKTKENYLKIKPIETPSTPKINVNSFISIPTLPSPQIRKEEPLLRILMVDDEPFNLRGLRVIMKKAVSNLGHNPDILEELIDQCFNGQEALDLVSQAAYDNTVYSLILMDQSMPVMDGIEATKRIRAFIQDKDLP